MFKNIKKEVTSRGLRTLYIPMKETKTVAVLVLVGVGARNESRRVQGVSHFLEHMAFKGTVKRPDKLQIAQELDAVGAEFNAFTAKELTGYWVKSDARHLALSCDMLADIFLNSTIPAAELNRERGVILGEIDLYEDLPTRKAAELFETLLYGDHPAGRPIIGTKDSVGKLTRRDLLQHRETFYRARNTIVAVAGNIESRTARSLVRKNFRDIRKGYSPSPLPVKERQREARILIHRKQTDQTHLVLGCRAVSMKSQKRWPLLLLATILGGNMSSRLFVKIREELGLGYYIRAHEILASDHGYFEISAGVKTSRVEEATEAILSEVRRIKQDGVSEQELSKAREFIKGSTLMDLESSDEVADFFGFQELEFRRILTPEQKFRILDTVTTSHVRRIAEEVFQSERLNAVYLGPLKSERHLRKLLTL